MDNFLARQWPVLVVCAAAAAGASVLLTAARPVTYTAGARLAVERSAEARAVLRRPDVLAQLADASPGRLDSRAEEAAGGVVLSVRARSRAAAAEAARAYARIGLEALAREATPAGLDGLSEPRGPRTGPLEAGGLGLAVGLASGVVAAWALDRREEPLGADDELLPPPLDHGAARAGLDPKVSSVLVTSAEAADPRAEAALALAQALTERGERVLLIDADLRRPRLHVLLDAPTHTGLTAALLADAPIDPVEAAPNLFLLAAGPAPPLLADLLAAGEARTELLRLQRLITTRAAQGWVVVVAGPPAAEATEEVRAVDAAVFVAVPGRTRRRAAVEALAALAGAGASVVGSSVGPREWALTPPGRPSPDASSPPASAGP